MALIEPGLLVPVRFSGSKVIRIADADETADVTINVTADIDWYNSGDNSTTVGEEDLIKQLQDDLNTGGATLTPAVTFTLTLSARNILTIAADNAVDVQWSHANTTFDPTVVGFTAVDTGSGTSHVAPDTTQGFWYPGTTSNSRHVREDTRPEPVTVGHLAETIDGQSRGYELTSSLGERTIQLQYIEREKILVEYADASEPYGALEYVWKTSGMAKGRPTRWYDDKSSRTSSSYTKWRTKTRDRPWTKMDVSSLQRYEVLFLLREIAAAAPS